MYAIVLDCFLYLKSSDLFAKKKKKLRKCADTDFGHLTYQRACSSVNATPCQKIIKLLKTGRLQMNFSGLNENESKALTRALKVRILVHFKRRL